MGIFSPNGDMGVNMGEYMGVDNNHMRREKKKNTRVLESKNMRRQKVNIYVYKKKERKKNLKKNVNMKIQ